MSIYKKLLNIQTKLKAPKTQTNKFGGYNYRSCEDILEAVKPLLNEEQVTILITDSMEQVGERYYIKACASLVDVEKGEEIKVYAYAREEESKPKMDSSQVTGSASSYARKYALNGLLAIDDNKDSDFTNTHGKEAESKQRLSNQYLNKLFKLGLKKGFSQNEVRRQITKKFNKTAEEMTTAEYKQVVDGYDKLPNKNE